MDITRKPLFKGTLTHPTIQYVGLPVRHGRVGAYIAWLDATSSATITLEYTSFGPMDAPVTTAGTYQWKDSGTTVLGPTAVAAGASMVNLDNVQQRRARLKIVTAATSNFEIHDGTEAALA